MFDRLKEGRREAKRTRYETGFHEAMREGRLDDAGTVLQTALADFPDDLAFARYQAEHCALRGDAEQARAHFARLRERAPQELSVWHASAVFAARQGDPDALAIARAAANLVPEAQRALFFTPLARHVYWGAPSSASTPDPDQLALHQAAHALRAIKLVGAVGGGEDESPLLWHRLPEDKRDPEESLQALCAQARAFAARPSPSVEVEGRARRLVDADPLIQASLEVVDLERGLRFLPFAALTSVRFEPQGFCALARWVDRQSEAGQGYLPLFYRHTLERRQDLLQANMTTWEGVYGDLRLPLGLRDYFELDDAGAQVGIVSPAHLLPHPWTFR